MCGCHGPEKGSKYHLETVQTTFSEINKAKLLLLKLIQIFARDVLIMKKLEIEETKTT